MLFDVGVKQMNQRIGAVVALVAMVLLALLLVSVKPELPLMFQKRTSSDSEYLAPIFSAPIVVVAVIQSDTLVHGPTASDQHSQLRKLQVRVENVLRGEDIPELATIYYYTWAGGFDGPRPLGFWMNPPHWTPIYRRIFWLRKDSGLLRTACDGWDECTMPANSGSHANYRPDPRKPLSYALADIFFTRGEGVSDAAFAAQVEWGAPGNVPEAYLFEKLQHLALTEPPKVRAAACKQLSYYGQKCAPPMSRPAAP
jgi:hypothetical protein